VTGVLEGIRILDFSRFGAGPLCPLLLADMGAEVIRIENLAERMTDPFLPQILFNLLRRGRLYSKKG
jgi:crotonobetainyl-CoA:carnitine CoA-transferase CaiB-like acyl-CoA transferase